MSPKRATALTHGELYVALKGARSFPLSCGVAQCETEDELPRSEEIYTFASLWSIHNVKSKMSSKKRDDNITMCSCRRVGT